MNVKRIAFLAGGYGPLPRELRRRHEFIQSFAPSGTRVDMYGGKGSMESRIGEYAGSEDFAATESEYDLAVELPEDLKVCVEAEGEGYDAIILSCAADPGLNAIREAVRIPVIGPGVTARHVCSLLGHRFTVLTTGKRGPIKTVLDHEVPHDLGRWVSTRSIGLSVLDVRHNPQQTFEATLREARTAMAEEGADAFTYGCMSMAFLDMDKKLEAELGVPFVNPVKVAVRIAGMYIDLQIKHSKITYPTPEDSKAV